MLSVIKSICCMEMCNFQRGYSIINEYFIEPMLKKNDRHIGMELEYPLIMNENTDAKSLVMKMFDYLIESFGFKEEKRIYMGTLLELKSKKEIGYLKTIIMK